jgi:hypothetical protein
MSTCKREIRHPPPQSVQAALDLFAARIFRYLRCAYKWFRSSSLKKVLGSGNANIYDDLKLHLENIRVAANIFQHASHDENSTEQGQEMISLLQRLEVIQLEQAANTMKEQQQLRADNLKFQENVERMLHMFDKSLQAGMFDKSLQVGMSSKKLLETNVQADLHEPIPTRRRHERYFEGTGTQQLRYTTG